jgi:AAA15 family ATPase/GTPase
MLIDFTFKNYLSYRNETRLLLTKIKSFDELKDTNTIEVVNRDFNLLKTAAIFGSNGGGKSNFISAIDIMKKIVHSSFSESLKPLNERGKIDVQYKLNTNSINEPSSFEVSFIKNEIIYRYGFEIFNFEIISEWLFRKVETETMLFKRKKATFSINKSGFPEGVKYHKEVKDNVLLLSHLAQNKDAPIANEVLAWFHNLNIVNGLDEKLHKNATKFLLKNSGNFRKWIIRATNFLDISEIELTENDKLITIHKVFNDYNEIVDTITFDLEQDESAGTQKLIYLLGAIYDSLVNGKVLFIDELNSKLHPNLTKKLLFLFHELNKKNAQIVFTIHDACILDKEILRRDQIWFVDRNNFGESELYPMSDFKSSGVRKTSDFRKKYLNSDFGAAESISITHELTELMYEKK